MWLQRVLIAAFGGLYNALIGRRSAVGAAAIILDADGRVLLVHHSYGKRNWDLPGGAGKRGESAADAALREVREEVGLEVVIDRLAGLYYVRDFDQHSFAFRCHPVDERLSPTPSSPEILECRYWPHAALPRPMSDFTVRRIEDALAGLLPDALVQVGQRRWLD